MFWRREQSLASTEIRNPDRPALQRRIMVV